MATTIINTEAVATEELAAKVLATKMAKTATTKTKVNQIKIRNSVLALLLTFFPITVPTVLPSCLTDEISDIKSCTPPINILPKTIHKKQGSQPKQEAAIGPTIGPPPAIEAK